MANKGERTIGANMAPSGAFVRIRLNATGSASLDELRGVATRVIGKHASYGTAIDVALKFYQAVDPRERTRALNAVKQELVGSQLRVPGTHPR